jgi:hypothetical protein
MWEETQERLRLARQPKEKKVYKGPKKVSDKRAAKIAAEKEVRGEDETFKEKWFKARRRELTGTCQCGCSKSSSKNDDLNFRSSCCHVFPQRLFPSIALHPLNCVERNFWDGCHSNMDNQSMDKWPMFADWEDIKERFYILSPLLTDEERATKFYSLLEKLVYS